MLKKYIDSDQFDHGGLGAAQLGRKSRNSSSSSSIADSKSSQSSASASSESGGASSFNIKNLDEEEERDLRRYEIQCELNSQGASDLVVDLFMNDISNKVFKETVLLAIALLEGGNTQVQVGVFTMTPLNTN